ncbi:enoyl-CoA hydratase/isomerase family protein [Nakamurella sp. YIM 132087]|uniref:Enoyl-CoA hydratase/isomerase family protein n=1 Tax=Nakamurella alba TaxID=2665158 RepID=A0A7K1FE62_9ACTN|nr:enoyl-CoA hydratase/isomerase family protein [Nakamurella alba]MTD12395.1 enoyl-CoA hydratase/isomerase family protein [Nakamurella alba]
MSDRNRMVTLDRRENGVAVLTLVDHTRRNALGSDMAVAIERAVGELRDDPGLRCLVVTGAPPAFSSGGDLAMLTALQQRAAGGVDVSADMHRFYRQCLSFRELPVPTIAAVAGAAVGAGLCLALGCDIRIVAEDARLRLNFSRLGLHPGMGGSWFLPRLVGVQHAAYLLFSGSYFSGQDAARMGLALESVPAQSVLDRALQIADGIAESSPAVLGALAAHLRSGAPETLEQAFAREGAAQADDFGSAAFAEGLRAAGDRRVPDFAPHVFHRKETALHSTSAGHR